MNEQMKIPVQFLTAGNSVRPEKRALFEALMSAVLLGMETAERNLNPRNQATQPPAPAEPVRPSA